MVNSKLRNCSMVICGLNLPPATGLNFGILTRLLRTILVAQIVRYDQPTAIGPWWSGTLLEARVAARYRCQQPRRPWPQSVGSPTVGRRLGQRVSSTGVWPCPGRFAAARREFPFAPSGSSVGGRLEGTRFEVVTLACRSAFGS